MSERLSPRPFKNSLHTPPKVRASWNSDLEVSNGGRNESSEGECDGELNHFLCIFFAKARECVRWRCRERNSENEKEELKRFRAPMGTCPAPVLGYLGRRPGTDLSHVELKFAGEPPRQTRTRTL